MSRIAKQIDAYLDQVAEDLKGRDRWSSGPKRPDEVIEEDGYLTVIWYIGHQPAAWGGPEDRGIAHLLWMLTEYTLDPTFEEYGNFVQRNPGWLADIPWRPAGTASIGGNFHDYSCAFGLETNHPDLIDLLEEAMRTNQASDAYQQARAELLARKVAEVEQRETQEVARAAAQVEAQHAYESAMRRRGF